MRSEFCQWLLEFQEVASKENIIVEARHFDVLEYYFTAKEGTLEQTLEEYKNFRKRWYAINGAELPVSSNLKPIDPTK